MLKITSISESIALEGDKKLKSHRQKVKLDKNPCFGLDILNDKDISQRKTSSQ